MTENKPDLEKATEITNPQKLMLECINRNLKDEKKPERMLELLHLRFQLNMSREQVADRLELDRESVRRIELTFLAKIAPELSLTPNDIKKLLAVLPLGIEEAIELVIKKPAENLPVIIPVEDLFKTLCEHIVLTGNEERVVKQPLRTLQARTNLSAEDAELALKGMKSLRLIEGEHPWSRVKITPEVAVPEFKGYK